MRFQVNHQDFLPILTPLKVSTVYSRLEIMQIVDRTRDVSVECFPELLAAFPRIIGSLFYSCHINILVKDIADRLSGVAPFPKGSGPHALGPKVQY